MKTYLKYISIFTIVLTACTKDFIVKDIKKETITINSPSDNLTTPSNTITFWWEELDGAENYNLQIVKPSFSSTQQLILDTTLVKNKFLHTFTPGIYQWRIKAINAGGSTEYITRTFTIDTTSNLGFLSVSLVNPISKSVVGNNSVIFSWNSLAAASYYELKITSLLTNSVTTISNITTTSDPYTFGVTSGNEETFSWQVKAFNSFSQTQNNLSKTFKIDFKNPNLASLLPNTYGVMLKDTNNLTWTRGATDVKYDVVSIGEDSSFVSAYTTTVNTTPYFVKINSAYTYTGTPAKSLWWKVVSYDSVGNISAPSISKRFYIQ